MTSIAPVDSTLEKLLVQSLDAAARAAHPSARAVVHVETILAQLARFFRRMLTLRCETVIEAGSAPIDIDGRSVSVPRLLVQCRAGRGAIDDVLTLVYTPRSLNCIELTVQARSTKYPSKQGIFWNAEHGWHFPNLGRAVDSASHGEFIRTVLFETGLFSALTFSLEPMGTNTGDSSR